MKGILLIFFLAVFLLLAATLLTVVAFGVRSLVRQRHGWFTIVSFATPPLLLVILALIYGDWTVAGILTVLFCSAMAASALLFSGVRSTIEG